MQHQRVRLPGHRLLSPGSVPDTMTLSSGQTAAKGEQEMAVDALKERILEVVASLPNVVALFREIDEDGEGTLDLKEFRQGLRAMGIDDVPKPITQRLFQQLAGQVRLRKTWNRNRRAC